MSLVSAIKEIEKEEKKILNQEAEDDTAPPEETDERDQEKEDDAPDSAAAEEDEQPEAAKEKPKTALKKEEAKKEEPVKEQTPDNAAFMKLRRDAAAAQRRAAELEETLRRQQTRPPEVKKPDAANTEPDPNTDPEAHLRWQLSKTQEQLKELADWKQQESQKTQRREIKDAAVKEYGRYEQAFSGQVKDYADVMDHGIAAISTSIRTLRPDLDGEALGEAVQHHILKLAGEGMKNGYDPAEYLYHLARSWGYQPKAVEAKQPEAEKPKPNLKQIAANRKKAVSSLTAGGKSGNIPLSREAVLDKSFGLQDFARLSQSQLKELEGLEE